MRKHSSSPRPRSMRATLLGAAATALLASGASLHGQAMPPSDPGALVVIGGGLSADNEAVYRAILDEREGDGPLCIVATAGADPEGSAASAVARFDRWGGEGTARAHPLPEEETAAARDPEVVAALSGCAGYFFTGGSQSRILNLFRPDGESTPAGEAILARWHEGAVISGSSAGAAMMSDPMIAGGTSAGAFRNATDEGGVRLAPGMGFVPDLLVDQHFLARGRIGRLLIAVLEPEGIRMGAGIDEDTALLVRGRELEVVGASGVVMVDGRSAAGEAAPPGARAYGPIRVELLGPGDRMSLDDWVVRPAAAKTSIAASERRPTEVTAPAPGAAAPAEADPDAGPADLFDRWVFLHAVEAMARGLEPSGEHAVEAGSVTLRKGDSFRGLAFPAGTGAGPDGSAHGLSAGPFLVRIHLDSPPDPGP
ncbi:MAG: cyanophycinase [Gemmatimonadales bacterium]|nr:MAG: cyanophycinase [Gemmatimonadales bacterium]